MGKTRPSSARSARRAQARVSDSPPEWLRDDCFSFKAGAVEKAVRTTATAANESTRHRTTLRHAPARLGNDILLTAMDVPVGFPHATVSKLDECFDVENL
jgi:hypothetical protein